MIIIADDPLVRAGLASSLEDVGELVVVAQLPFAGLEEEELEQIKADLILVDEGWLEGDFNDVTRRIEYDLPTLHLVDPARIERSNRDRFASVISRESEPEAIISAIQAVMAGWIVRDPLFSHHAANQSRPELQVGLTDREQEVLELTAEGMTNRAISNQLEISENTVKYHINSILSKLGAQSRTEAVVIAARSGLLPL